MGALRRLVRKPRPAELPGVEHIRYAPGEAAPPSVFAPGDFILTHSPGWQNALIRWGQRLRFRGRNRPFAHWSHAALVADAQGGLIEAVGGGVRRAHLDDYRAEEYHLVRLGALADERDRRQAVAYAEWCLGEEYGMATIVSIALSLVTGSTLHFGFQGQAICSGLVARALERTDAIFDRPASHVLPADLARLFGVRPPAKR